MHEWMCLNVKRSMGESREANKGKKVCSSNEKITNLHFFFVLRLLCTIFATLI